ncbi:uncharacterized protein Tco025E_05263 [Trypanosoma conorhini]|uniref:Uncharacterized protein n=1 Tax=Trypanosoma conorhini TaxID=83891 RepID=A0A3R7N5C6_9TRYP|nr:uncharacterized protein Tco025E_05263 [Trypanosoma conorhini]RNF16350.1 hypothetical protein Tco025E_05263 [Trypanosoma conorhini]
METIKGLARRATQSLREKVLHGDASGHDETLEAASKKVFQYQRSGEAICVKMIRAAELIEELGKVLKEVAEEYQNVPDLLPVSSQLAADVLEVGTKLFVTAQEHQKGLKEQGFDVLNSFIKNISKLKDAEEARRKNQLEYDFFRQKVLGLRAMPPKDKSRIPRNEQKLENWRVEFWRATENSKAVCSQLYAEGRRAIDLSVLTLTRVLGSFLSIAGNGFKQQFVNARLPVYPTTSLLPSAPLPPNPMPPYQPPPPQAGGYAAIPYGQPQAQQNSLQGQPPQVQQWQGWNDGHPTGWSQQHPQQPQPPSFQPHFPEPQRPWGHSPSQARSTPEAWQVPEGQQQQQDGNFQAQNTSSSAGLQPSLNNCWPPSTAFERPPEGNGNGAHAPALPQPPSASMDGKS